MKNLNLFCFILQSLKRDSFIFLSFILFSVNAQTVSWTTEATQACNVETSQDPTSVTTYNGSIYYIYVNTLRQMVVAKKTGNIIQTNIVFNIQTAATDLYHVSPTIGVDKNGYIHICGDMHNANWKYYRSNNPEDITSWTARSLPGIGITYTNIVYDNNREMFICFRHESNVAGKGNHRGGIIRYNADLNTFTMLGGTNYEDTSGFIYKVPPAGSKPTTMIWGNGFGGNDCWYLKPGQRVFFDKNNRMHLICALINVCINSPYGYESNTHIIYAYSDDLGQTWHKAGGEAIASLPLTVNNATVVLDRTDQQDIFGGECELGAFDSEHPIVSYKLSSNNSTHSLKWNGNAWIEIYPPHSTNIFMSRTNGYTAWFNGTYIDYTNDGITWKVLRGSPVAFPGGTFGSMGGIDREYFKATGSFRYHGKFNNFSSSSIFTINSNIGNEINAIESPKFSSNKPTGAYKLYTIQGKLIGEFDGGELNSVFLKQQRIMNGVYLAVPFGDSTIMRKALRICI